jgi:hypothetical protein
MPFTIIDLDAFFSERDGFPRPDWAAIREFINKNAAADSIESAWQEITREWLRRVADRLGGKYTVAESACFHLLSELEGRPQKNLLAFLETTRARMVGQLGDDITKKGHGKHVVLRISSEQDFYQYLSFFYPDGEHAGASGVLLRGGYLHIAYYSDGVSNADRAILVHELTHNLLVRLPLPSWLNEALAMAFEVDITQRGRPPLDRDLAERHRSYWNAETIQEFWSGISFHKVDSQELAYSLAQILLNLIATELRPPQKIFREFVLHAHYKDAGHAAANEYLDLDLGNLVSAFLGPGEWSPKGPSALTTTANRARASAKI